jgi:hypothetical protein
MNNRIIDPPEEPQRIKDVNLPPKLREIFQNVFHEFYELGSAMQIGGGNTMNTEDTTERSLCERIQRSVAEHPILACTCTVSYDRPVTGWSLLAVISRKTFSGSSVNRDVGLATMKTLINLNPHALIWGLSKRHGSANPLWNLVRNSGHSVLLPWIAEHHPWVFDHPKVRKHPPHFELVERYTHGRRGQAILSSSVVRSFYEWYPQGLEHIEEWSGQAPLHFCVDEESNQCDAELFEWMARKYPAAMSLRDKCGMTPLQHACAALASDPRETTTYDTKYMETMARICRFLIWEYPHAVRMQSKPHDNILGLPIHFLTDRCNRPLVQDIVIRLLKEYPQAVEAATVDRPPADILPKLGNVPFIQLVHPLLQQQADLEDERVWLHKACADFAVSTDSLVSSSCTCAVYQQVSEVFLSWARNRLTVEFQPIEADLLQQIEKVKEDLQGDDDYSVL